MKDSLTNHDFHHDKPCSIKLSVKKNLLSTLFRRLENAFHNPDVEKSLLPGHQRLRAIDNCQGVIIHLTGLLTSLVGRQLLAVTRNPLYSSIRLKGLQPIPALRAVHLKCIEPF